MNCISDNVTSNFPDLENGMSLTNYPLANQLKQYVSSLNTMLETIQFPLPIMEVEISVDGKESLIYHKENLKQLDAFMDQLDAQETVIGEATVDHIFETNGELFAEDVSSPAIIYMQGAKRYNSTLSNPVTNTVLPIAQRHGIKDWYESREKLLSSLMQSKKNLFKRGDASKEEIQGLNDVIGRVVSELKELNSKMARPELMYPELDAELTSIEDFFTNNNISNTTAGIKTYVRTLENNRIKDRIDLLANSFREESKSPNSKTIKSFSAGLDPATLVELQNRISQLSDRYTKNLPGVMFGLLATNDNVFQKINKPGKTTEEATKIANFLSQIKDALNDNPKLLEGDTIGGQTLGGQSYNSLLANIITSYRDVFESKEQGTTKLWKSDLKTSYDKIKNIKIDGKPLVELIFQTTNTGNVRTNTMLPTFTRDFSAELSTIFNYNKNFLRASDTKKAKAYSEWMQAVKDGVDYIDLTKIERFTTKHANSDDFKNYFKSTSQESQDYEARLKTELGEIAFETLLENQIEKAERFLAESYADPFESIVNNPIHFISHFNGTDFTSSDTNGLFPLPTFLNPIPKIENAAEQMNQSLKELSDANIPGLLEFYKTASKISKYYNSTHSRLNPENRYTAPNTHIAGIEDRLSEEIMKDLTFFGKISKYLQETWRDITSRNYGVTYNNNTEESPDKINSHMGSYGSGEVKRLVDIYVNNYTVDEISEMYSKKFEDVPELAELIELDGEPTTDQDIAQYKEILAKDLALAEINESSSTDVYKRLMYMSSLAESANTRNNTKNIIKLVKEYIATEATSLPNTTKFINSWEKNNVDEKGSENKIEQRRVVFSGKQYSAAEQKVLDKFKEAANYLTNKHGEYEFELNGSVYTYEKTQNKEQYLKDGEAISKKEYERRFENHVEEAYPELGSEMTIGSLLKGSISNIALTFLRVNPYGYLNNRIAGYSQNNQLAASGRYGFSTDDLFNARVFLNGSNRNKLVEYLPESAANSVSNIFGQKYIHKRQQWGIMMHLAKSMNMLENVVDDIYGADNWSNVTRSKLKEFSTDFTMNMPELHNQMELLVAMMQQNDLIEKKDSEGNITRVALFDTETMSFPFDPETFQLLPEYQTENNKANWEEFIADKSGNAPNSTLFQNYQSTKHKGHGNHKRNDEIALRSTNTGKALTTFLRWAFENTNTQYGYKKFDLMTMDIDSKGRKLKMIENFPVLATHYLMNSVGIVSAGGVFYSIVAGTGSVSSIAGATALAGFATSIFGGAGILLGIGTLVYQARKNKVDFKASKKDAVLSLNYALEILIRAGATSVNTTSNFLANKQLISEKTVRSLVGINANKSSIVGMSYEDRVVLSESAQEVADKINVYVQFGLVQASMIGMIALINFLNGDDDEDSFYQIMEQCENNMKWLMNTRNACISVTSPMADPSEIASTFSTTAYIPIMSNFAKKYFEVDEGNSWQDTGVTQAKAIASIGAGVPLQFMNAIDSKQKYFDDDRVYQPKYQTFIDELVLGMTQPEDKQYKSLIEKRKKPLREKYASKFMSAMKQRNEQVNGGMTNAEIKEAASKRITRIFKDAGVTAGKGEYKNLWDNVDWGEMENVLDGELEQYKKESEGN